MGAIPGAKVQPHRATQGIGLPLSVLSRLAESGPSLTEVDLRRGSGTRLSETPAVPALAVSLNLVCADRMSR
jgi:hypothetical protein